MVNLLVVICCWAMGGCNTDWNKANTVTILIAIVALALVDFAVNAG